MCGASFRNLAKSDSREQMFCVLKASAWPGRRAGGQAGRQAGLFTSWPWRVGLTVMVVMLWSAVVAVIEARIHGWSRYPVRLGLCGLPDGCHSICTVQVWLALEDRWWSLSGPSQPSLFAHFGTFD